MTKNQVREARHKKIAPLIKKARTAQNNGFILTIPSVQGGFHLYELPVVESLESTANNRKVHVFDNVERDHGKEGLETLFLHCLGHVMNQTVTEHSWDEQADILWFIFNYFTHIIDKEHEQNNTTKCVEIFDDEQFVFIDFNLMEQPNGQSNGFEKTIH